MVWLVTCSVAAIIAFLGYMPAKGDVAAVPRSTVNQLTVFQQVKARACAARYGIKWKIQEGR